jgi:hypothetical protein
VELTVPAAVHRECIALQKHGATLCTVTDLLACNFAQLSRSHSDISQKVILLLGSISLCLKSVHKKELSSKYPPQLSP